MASIRGGAGESGMWMRTIKPAFAMGDITRKGGPIAVTHIRRFSCSFYFSQIASLEQLNDYP